MATFSFSIGYGGHKHWIHGQVLKDADTGRFIATSALFEGYQGVGDFMNLAVGAFRDGLLAWLAEHPEQVPKREAIHDG